MHARRPWLFSAGLTTPQTMDPISAFSLAVNILTVVDFSLKILSAASEIRSRGDTVTRSDRRLVSEDLLSCCAKLKAARAEEAGLPGSPSSPAAGQVATNDQGRESIHPRQYPTLWMELTAYSAKCSWIDVDVD
jgi:hypothetical protein